MNFGSQLPNERAGITHQVELAGMALAGWSIYPLPMQQVGHLEFSSNECRGACFYQATFDVDNPADTFVDAGSLSKGEVWINGQPLGRFWKIGPQRTLYLPAPFLKKGRNEIIVFDLDGKSGQQVSFSSQPSLGSDR